MKKINKIVLVSLALTAGSVLADNINGVNMDFVNIGSAGYAADAATGYGAVGYNYRIGTTEVTISQFQASGIVDVDANYWNALGAGAPVSKISWHEAARYANWLTSSNANNGAYTIVGDLVTAVDRASAISTYGTVYVLPTEDEWYKAAYFTGAGYSTYANGTGTAPVNGVDSLYGQGGFAGPAWTVGSGTVEQNGTFDMMGNLWEWTESAFDGNLDSIGETIAFRGGDYWQGASKLVSTNRQSDDPTAEYQVTGMRIVAIPEPGTISLMSLSTISLFLARRVRRRKLAGKSLFPIRREYSCDLFEEQDSRYDAAYEFDYLAILKQMAKDKAVDMWNRAHAFHQTTDKMFWNWMVVSQERRMMKIEAFQKKVLDRLDAFLALIMK